MKLLRLNPIKSQWLKITRGFSFEDVLSGRMIDVRQHISRSGQRIMIVLYKEEIWVVPFIENEKEIFVKTCNPSRKYRKIYLSKGGV